MKMNINKSKLLVMAAITGLITMGSFAFADPNHSAKNTKYHGQEKMVFMQKRFERMSAKLGLSEIQKQEAQTLMKNHRNAVKPLINEKRGLRKEMRNLDPATNDYTAKLAYIANRKAEIVRQLTIAKGNKRQQMAQILTPQQRAKRQEMRANRKDNFHRRRHNRH